MNAQTVPQLPPIRVRIFVDFWNFSLSIKSIDANFKVDWQKLGQIITIHVDQLLGAQNRTLYEAMHVYGSYDPLKPQDIKLRNWFTNTLDKFPGVHVEIVQRQKKKAFPKCPSCQTAVARCPQCQQDMRGTEEKGVDTRIVTNMISLAWSNAYDVAVLISADRDFVPVAEFYNPVESK